MGVDAGSNNYYYLPAAHAKQAVRHSTGSLGTFLGDEQMCIRRPLLGGEATMNSQLIGDKLLGAEHLLAVLWLYDNFTFH